MRIALLSLTLGVALAAQPVSAQLTCEDIEFDEQITDQFPAVSDACREVVTRGGVNYAKLRADVLVVRQDPRDRDLTRVTLQMLDAQDEPIDRFSLRLPRDFRYTVDGEIQRSETLSAGQELTVYLPPDRWELVWTLAEATPFEETIRVEDVESFSAVAVLETDDVFEFDSATLTDAGKARLDVILEATGDLLPLIDITGHSDRIGDPDYNVGLSERRAEAARQYLISQGVPESRVRARGVGASEPLVDCPNLTGEELKECLAPNRRAEVRFLRPMSDALVEVTRRYRKPDGEIVEVVEYESVTTVSAASTEFANILAQCEGDIETFCGDRAARYGDVQRCLFDNSMLLSRACTNALSDAAVAVARRERQINLIGEVCATDLAAHCEMVPLVDKVACLAQVETSPACAAALAQLQQ